MSMQEKNELKKIEKDESVKWEPLGAFLITIAAYIASQIALVILLVAISHFKPGQNVQNLLNSSTWLELLLTGLSSATMLGVLWIYLKKRKSSFRNLGFRRIKWSDLGWLLVGVVGYFVIVSIVLEAASYIPGFNANQTQNVGYQGATGLQLVLAFIGLVVLPPIAEEMLFRGFLYRGLAKRLPKILSALITSGLFALLHFQWNVSLDVFVLSLVLIALYEKTKNLWVCVGLHAIKNGIAYLALFVFVSR